MNLQQTSTLNWLRASVLGANDGIVSVSSVIVGVAGASNSSGFILTAGIAALVAGALSMAVGEYVSVSTQRDTEKALLKKEKGELDGINPDDLSDPWHAAWASGVSFFAGAVIPILAIVLSPQQWRVWSTCISVIIALIITGWLSAYAGGAPKRMAVIRVVCGGIIAMAVTFGIGKLFGVVGI